MKKIVFALMAMSLMNVTFMSAQEAVSKGDLLVRLRGVGVVPSESSKVGIIGGDVTLSNAFIPELDFTYFFTDHIAAELILGTAKHDVGVVNSAAGNVDLGSVWLLPPTLTAQYHFYTSDEKVFKPYVGAGLNYTLFYNEKSGDVAGISYDNALGYAVQLGFDLMISDKFFINVDAKRLFLNTDVTVDASNLAPGLSIPAEVDIDPWLLGFGIGMKF
uniref:OmpW/AlkL family protein n=1 Tax=Flavobacterium sp. TaxID=239 RepID=UPI00404AA6ED